MINTMAIIEARNRLTALPEEFEREGKTEAVTVTRRGKPVLAVMPWEFYETLRETLEVLGDEKLMAEVRRGIEEIQRGKGVPWQKARKRLGV